MVQKSHGDDASVAEARVFRRHASLNSCFSTQKVPIVNGAISVGTAVAPLGDGTVTRNPVSTHLMSNVSRGRPASSLIAPIKMAWALFQKSLFRIEFESGPYATSLNLIGALARACWRSS